MFTSRKYMISFIFTILLFLAGCSLHPQELATDKVEEIVKEAINPQACLSDAEPKITELYDGWHYVYSFIDERGIPFTVEVTSPYYSLVDFRKGVYEDYVVFHTDYRSAVMNYYHAQVEDLLESANGISFDEKDPEIIRISDGDALASLDEILLKMDALYDFHYAYSGELRLEPDKKVYWEDFRQYDLLIRYNGKQENIFFTVGDDEVLSIDDIHETMENLRED